MQTISLLKETIKTEESASKASTIVPVDFTHGYGIGKTGCGKTTSFIYPNLLDRMEKGHGILIYDYKGKEHVATKALAKRAGRLDDVVEIGKDWGKSIDILYKLNDAQVYEYLESIFSMDENNQYWGKSSTNYAYVVYMAQKKLAQFADAVIALPGEKYDLSTTLNTHKYNYSASATLLDIRKVFTDEFTVRAYTEGFKKLLDNCYEVLQTLKNKITKSELRNLSYFYVHLKTEFNKCLTNLKSLCPKNERSTSATIQTHLLAISGPLNGITQTDYLNKNDMDLYAALEEGKIVVIDTASFPDIHLSAFTEKFLSNLSKRVNKPLETLNPVSLFVDEVQRVVRENTNFAVDILREAKIELLIAFQNHELVIDKMGENNFHAFLKNFSYKYHYANDVKYRGKDISKLNTFEYMSSDSNKVEKASAIFLESKELFDAQLEFQRKNKIHEKYNLPEKYKKQIIDNVIDNIIMLRQSNGKYNEVNSVLYSTDDIKLEIDEVLKELYADSFNDGLDEMYYNERLKRILGSA